MPGDTGTGRPAPDERPAARIAATLARRDVQALAALVVAQVVLVVGYFAATSARPTAVRYAWYPVVWITVGAWAVATRSPAPAGRRRRALAAAVGVAYLLVLAWLGDVVTVPGHAAARAELRVIVASPGRGPALQYATSSAVITAIPYRLVGYAALSYLLYVAVLDASGAALTGVLGVASCISCSLPLVGTLLAGFSGGAAGAVSTAYAFSADLSTLAFLVAVAGLYWGPSIGSALARARNR